VELAFGGVGCRQRWRGGAAHRVLVLLRGRRQGLGDGVDTEQLLLEAVADLLQLTLLHQEDARDLEQLLGHGLQNHVLRAASRARVGS